MALADFEDDVLDVVGVRVGGQLGELGVEILQRGDLMRRSGARRFRVGRDEIAGVIDRQADQLVELGIALRRRARRIALDEPPGGVLVGARRAG